MYDICISTCMCIRVYNCEIANILFLEMSQVMWYLNMFCTQQLFNIPPTFLKTWVKELQRRIKNIKSQSELRHTVVLIFHTTRECDVYIPRDCTCISPEYMERHLCNDNPPPPPSTNEEPHLSYTYSNTCSRKKKIKIKLPTWMQQVLEQDWLKHI